MSRPLLSICMPTYNFGAFIGETLESIVPQLTPNVEIIVLDGGSTDNTPQAVGRFVREHPALSYVQQPFKGGIDRDMARSVDLARGDYVWLFSSDDVMRPWALGRALEEIESGLDLYLCGLTLCDKQMHILGEQPVSSAPWGSVFHLADAGERERYFALAQRTTALFSFMGSLIFRRSKWQEGRLEEAYVGSCWAHVVRFMRLVRGGLNLKYLGVSLQLKRGDNDSFIDKGVIHRYGITIDGYHRIAADVFGEKSIEARHIRRVIADEFPLSVMFYTRVLCRDEGRVAEIPELNRLVAKTYCDLTWRNLVRRVAYSRMFELLYTTTRKIYRFLRRYGLAAARR